VLTYLMRRGAGLVFAFLAEGPVDCADDLGCSDDAGEGGPVVQGAHEIAPGGGPDVPCVGIALRVDEGHDAVSDEGHGDEVFPAFGGQEHGIASRGLGAG
jgi:hypothetical protein